jgi:hypothetical protein
MHGYWAWRKARRGSSKLALEDYSLRLWRWVSTFLNDALVGLPETALVRYDEL